jgi:hypothetical protein
MGPREAQARVLCDFYQSWRKAFPRRSRKARSPAASVAESGVTKLFEQLTTPKEMDIDIGVFHLLEKLVIIKDD